MVVKTDVQVVARVIVCMHVLMTVREHVRDVKVIVMVIVWAIVRTHAKAVAKNHVAVVVPILALAAQNNNKSLFP